MSNILTCSLNETKSGKFCHCDEGRNDFPVVGLNPVVAKIALWSFPSHDSHEASAGGEPVLHNMIHVVQPLNVVGDELILHTKPCHQCHGCRDDFIARPGTTCLAMHIGQATSWNGAAFSVGTSFPYSSLPWHARVHVCHAKTILGACFQCRKIEQPVYP